MKISQDEGRADRFRLSICIATYNRGALIGETLDSILVQMRPDVELIVVDGASPDNTSEVMAKYVSTHPGIRYYRELENSGVDCDYDKAVGYAAGEYCWLLSDDDLLRVGAISRVLEALDRKPDLVVVNSEVRNTDFSQVLQERMLAFSHDRTYEVNEHEKLFAEVANYLSFIGAVVIRRGLWLARDRSSYFGTLFIHVGVIFQRPPLQAVHVIAEPLIVIRYGNAMWTPRSFEIWMLKWPNLIWSFPDFSAEAKQTVCRREPWRHAKTLLLQRALGTYSVMEFRKFFKKDLDKMQRMIAYLIGKLPAALVNLAVLGYFLSSKRSPRTLIFDLMRSRHAGSVSRMLVRFFAR